MKKKLVFVVVGSLVLVIGALGLILSKSKLVSNAATLTGSLNLSPASNTYPVGSTFDVDININTGGTYVDGADVVSLHYPAQFLKATAVKTGNIASFNLSPNPIVPDNTAGKITFVAYVNSGSTGYNGTGKLATVTFQALATTTAANVTFDFNSAAPSTADCNIAEHGTGNDILGSVTNANFNLTSTSAINVSLKLQGRTNATSSGGSFRVYSPGTTTLIYNKTDLTTGATGTSQFSAPISPGTYDVKIKVNYFLSRKLVNVTLTNPLNLDFGTLRAADLNNDDVVNSLDFAVLNSKWLQSDIVSDINIDGIVNTLDYSYMNGNWLQAGQ